MSVLGEVLRGAAERFPERPALVMGDVRLTYAEVDAIAGEAAAGFAARGVRAGQLVALALPNGLEFVLAYLGLARLDAVTTGINARATAAERAKVLDRAAPDLVVGAPELLDGAEGLAVADGGLLSEVRIPGDGGPALRPFDPDAPETVVFTSGTTGVPKGALFRSRQIRAITDMDTGGSWGHGGAALIATGLAHVGFLTKLAGHVQAGATMHVLARWRAADALRIIAEEKVPIVGGVAAQISLLLALPDFDAHDLSAVKGLVVGAGPSPPALVAEAKRRFGCGYSIRYSSTESGGLGTLTAFDADEAEQTTVGKPRPGTDLEIRDVETGAVLPPGEAGQICLRSPAVMAGYWNDPEQTAKTLDPQGFLRTGDLGVIDERGNLRITGRVSEMFIRGGYNVYPLEVEAVLADHPDIAAVVVVPRPSDVMGEIGVAVVVPRAGSSAPTVEELRAFAGSRLAAYKLPEAVREVDAIPLTSMDKIDRRALIEHERLG